MTARTIALICTRCQEHVQLPRQPKTDDDVRCPICCIELHTKAGECPACLVCDPILHEYFAFGGWWEPQDDSQETFDYEYRRRKEREQDLAI